MTEGTEAEKEAKDTAATDTTVVKEGTGAGREAKGTAMTGIIERDSTATAKGTPRASTPTAPVLRVANDVNIRIYGVDWAE